jgi:hypothetical protein
MAGVVFVQKALNGYGKKNFQKGFQGILKNI